MENKQLVELLADKEHASWAHWMGYVFNICPQQPDGSVSIPPELVKRWKRQVFTAYAELSETEKESDRKEVREILPIIEAHVEDEIQRYGDDVNADEDFMAPPSLAPTGEPPSEIELMYPDEEEEED